MCSGFAPNVRETRDLVRFFAAGTLPEDGFRQLFAVYYPRLRRFFEHKSSCRPEDAEDLAQETLTRVFRHHGKPKDLVDVEHLQSWLFEIAANVYRNWLRNSHAAKRRGLESSLDVLEGAAKLLAELARTGEWSQSDPLAQCLDRERLASTARAFGELPAKMQRYARLFYGQGMSCSEVAEIEHVEVSTVRVQLHLARKRLKEILDRRFDATDAEVDEA